MAAGSRLTEVNSTQLHAMTDLLEQDNVTYRDRWECTGVVWMEYV